MTRKVLDSAKIHPAALEKMASRHADVVAQVEAALAKHKVVVVGMAQNPHVRRVRRALDDAKIAYEYLGYGSYFSAWGPRLSIKLWSGWPTFPQVFVDGVLLGGAELTAAAIAAGALQRNAVALSE